MEPKPLLVLQLRRLGDLILTFPLLMDLQLRFRSHPIKVVARPQFFRELLSIAPKASFYPPESLPKLAQDNYEALINLSSQACASEFMAQAKAGLKLGRIARGNGLVVKGFWQLYRECLTHNNRHNLFHWADLFRLDLGRLPLPAFVREREALAATGRIGLFIGASEATKRPGAEFWASLARQLAQRGFKPILLGGSAEAEMAKTIMARGMPAVNFCGQTSLAQLAAILQSCDLLLAPDTGPMHLADFLGVRVLNLSLGNVQPLETGPYAKGQFVLEASMSCVGCWQCQGRELACHKNFDAAAIADLTARVLKKQPELVTPPGLDILTTARDDLGLHTLAGLPANARTCLGSFWKAAFLCFYEEQFAQRFELAAARLKLAYPHLAASMLKAIHSLQNELALALRHKRQPTAGFWQKYPTSIRIFAGWLELWLQNANAAPKACVIAMRQLESVKNALKKGA